MTLFNQIGEYGLSELLTKRLTTPGGSSSPSVAPEIFPVLALESDRPEWSYLKGERLYAKQIFKAGVAAEFGMVQLYLPTNARTIAVVTRIVSQTASLLGWARLVGISGGLGGWAAVATSARDTRALGNGGSCILESNGNAALPAHFGRFGQLNGVGQETSAPLVIAPGGSICVFAEVVNQTLNANIEWYERVAQPGELA